MSGRSNRGFTIVELLVVVTIIGILMAILLPAIGAAMSTARRAQCTNKQHQIGIAIIGSEAKRQKMPYLRREPRPGGLATRNHSWIYHILQGMGRSDVFDEHERLYDQAKNPANADGFPIVEFRCPTDQLDGTQPSKVTYVANGGRSNKDSGTPIDWPENGAFSDAWRTNEPIIQTMANIQKADGTQMTLMITENVDADQWCDVESEASLCTMWYPVASENDSPNEGRLNDLDLPPANPNTFALSRPSSRHGSGFIATFCDNHTDFINDEIAYSVFARLMTSDGKKSREPGGRTAGPQWQGKPVTERDLDP